MAADAKLAELQAATRAAEADAALRARQQRDAAAAASAHRADLIAFDDPLRARRDEER